MQFKSYIQSKLPFYLALSGLFALASCGSYQYVGQDSDGIYGASETENVSDTNTVQDAPISSETDAYYKGYFAEKSDKYGRIANEEEVIFTDIDSYEGTYNENTGEVEYEEGYAGWGQDSENVTINVYSNYGWNGWYSPWQYGWGWNSWYNPWYGYGYGYGSFYNPYYFGYGYGYYGGYYNPYHFGYYHSQYGNYYGRDLAYNSGRRGSYLNNSNRSTIRSNTSSQTTRRNSSAIRRNTDSRYNPANSVRSNTRTNNSGVRSNNTRSDTRVNTPRNSTRSNTSVNRPTRSTRSNTRVNAPNRSSSSNSSTVRSSSSSSSSSGTRRHSSSGSSRRGG